MARVKLVALFTVLLHAYRSRTHTGGIARLVVGNSRLVVAVMVWYDGNLEIFLGGALPAKPVMLSAQACGT